MKKSFYDKNKFIFDFLLKTNAPLINNFVFNKVYDKHFFRDANALKITSARDVAKIINDNLKFKSVFDLGCGMGLYLRGFHKLKKEVLGCDFSSDALSISPKEFTIFHADVRKPIILNRKYDLLICFEVAEHLPNKYSQQLVKNCTNNGKVVIFTAADKYQGGVGHINEQPKSFWIKLFQKMNYTYDAEISSKICKEMKSKKVVYWLVNNLMCFRDINESS